MRASTLRLLVVLGVPLLAGLATDVHAATTKPKQLAGSGPIDRPTAHTNGWTFHEWSTVLCTEPAVDSFVADGDSAVVRWTVMNHRDGYPPLQFRLDNVVVATRANYEAHRRALGQELVNLYSSVVDPATEAFDFVPLLPDRVVFHDDFASGIGPQWSVDPQQVTWGVGYQNPDPILGGALFDDPFTPLFDRDGEFFSSTGDMRIGNGTGPTSNVVELQLDGLTRGVEYVVSYWSRSVYVGTTDFCLAPNAEWEVDVFGETVECLPDLAAHDVVGARTLDWDPIALRWRFQLAVENGNGRVAGPSAEGTLQLLTVPSTVSVIDGEAAVPDLAASTGGWSAPLEVEFADMASAAEIEFSFRIDYVDDCGEAATEDGVALVFGPDTSPTDAPAGAAALRVSVAPNPFNPRTRVRFEVERAGWVAADVVDVRGRHVRSLLRETVDAGRRDVVWDGQDDDGRTLASGIYLVVVRHAGGVERHKVALLR